MALHVDARLSETILTESRDKTRFANPRLTYDADDLSAPGAGLIPAGF